VLVTEEGHEVLSTTPRDLVAWAERQRCAASTMASWAGCSSSRASPSRSHSPPRLCRPAPPARPASRPGTR